MLWSSDGIIFHAHGSDSLSRIGEQLTGLGDINGDGLADFAVSSYSPYGSYLFFGGNPPDSTPDMFLTGFVYGTADFTGDGLSDLYCAKTFHDGLNWRGVCYFYQGFGDSVASAPYDSLASLSSNPYGGECRIAAGFMDGDSLADLLVHGPQLYSDTLYLYLGGTTLDTVPDWKYGMDQFHNIGSFDFIDWNGDGYQDLFASLIPWTDSVSRIALFLGPDLGQVPDQVIDRPADFEQLGIWPEYRDEFATGVVNVGDITGDGFEDLGVRFWIKGLIYSGGPSADSLYDALLAGTLGSLTAAGDINGDLYCDLVAGDCRTANGSVDVYLGGQQFDVHYDYSIYRSDLPPLFLEHIGYRLAGVADINGDHIDDLLFACQNFAVGDPGDVFVVKGGPHIVTDVNSDYHDLVNSFALHPNYPNPFNPSTTIAFDLPRRAHVTLTIVNILGQEVARLIDQEISAGSHSVEWDGRDASGNQAASGVYLYWLETEDGQLSRKMLLLK